jgi:hypothetical protein
VTLRETIPESWETCYPRILRWYSLHRHVCVCGKQTCELYFKKNRVGVSVHCHTKPRASLGAPNGHTCAKRGTVVPLCPQACNTKLLVADPRRFRVSSWDLQILQGHDPSGSPPTECFPMGYSML